MSENTKTTTSLPIERTPGEDDDKEEENVPLGKAVAAVRLGALKPNVAQEYVKEPMPKWLTQSLEFNDQLLKRVKDRMTLEPWLVTEEEEDFYKQLWSFCKELRDIKDRHEQREKEREQEFKRKSKRNQK